MPSAPQERIEVVGSPSVSVQDDQLRIGDPYTSSIRSYTPLRDLGEGLFSTVWLCDWHSALPPGLARPAMQNSGVRPEWTDKRLVAVKRVGRKWLHNSIDKELKVLRALPVHPNIVTLYDAFSVNSPAQTYLVLEPMEGTLYHLFKVRKGRSFAGVLVASIFRQIASAIFHIHDNGYFHRDMKPENILVTTTGIFEYTTISPMAPPDTPKERDVVVIIKLGDFGLARETNSNPPYTEYVTTRWYRAPEVSLLGNTYSSAVDMWGLGAIMAETLNLRPLFPGETQVDQIEKICAVLGDPSDEYGIDSSGIPIGGGPWPSGIALADAIGFQFPKKVPSDFASLFEPRVPISLISAIRGLLMYDPQRRLTSRECLEHPFVRETEAYLP
ncbi:Pkinase-domain-containing protein [Phlegmacium glaucopus]|nr:Pkinase-domain-containing protein [Phlegmacium glaucopus]